MEFDPDVRGDEIVITSSGAPGRDISFYGRARDKFPWVIECKNQEANKIMWHWYDQACSHKKVDEHGFPMVIFSKNHEEPMVTMRFEDFLKLSL